MTPVPFLDIAASHQQIRAEIDTAVRRVVDSGWFVLGPEVEAFEREYAEYVGARHCVGMGNGLDALHLSLRAAGVGAGDEVLVPAHTFVATWLAVTYAGAVPVPVDVDELSFTMSPAAADAAVSPRTAAMVPVHLYGRPADLAGLREVAQRHGLAIISDAAQAHGATLGGGALGRHDVATSWSFYPGKNLGALGDGGAVTTDDAEVASRLRQLRNYGSTTKYVHESFGFNSRLDEVQAAVLRAKLPHLDRWNARRAEVARRYAADLADVVSVPSSRDGDRHAWHLYVIRHADRDGLQSHLARQGVETLIHYPTPPHLQPAYSAHAGADLPVATRLAREVLSLPVGPAMSDQDVAAVIAAVRSHHHAA